MKQETITRIKLTASEGTVLTNGIDYGREIFLANTESADNWHEITEEKYAEILKSEDDLAEIETAIESKNAEGVEAEETIEGEV